MITQGSNLPLYFSNLPVSLESIADISAGLYTREGKELKHWGKDDLTITENGILAPISQSESMGLPVGFCYVELKFTDNSGMILPGIRVMEHVSRRDDKTELSGEQPQTLRYVDIDCSNVLTDVGAVVGASAYELAFKNGFEGTEEEWLENLRYDHSEEFAAFVKQISDNTRTAQEAAQTSVNAANDAADSESAAETAKNDAEKAYGNASTSESNAKASEEKALKASADAVAAKEEIQESANQIEKNSTDISELKGDLSQLSEEMIDKSKLSLGISDDGKIYIYYDGIQCGVGITIEAGNISGSSTGKYAVVFLSDFSGSSVSSNQFHTWDNRYQETRSVIYRALTEIPCINNYVLLSITYDDEGNKYGSLISTESIFEIDDGTIEFDAKWPETDDAWANLVLYGTGAWWSSENVAPPMKCLDWAYNGEVDCFEQAAGNIRCTLHWTNKGVNKATPVTIKSFDTTVWHHCKVAINNGVYSMYIDDELLGKEDGSEITTTNDLLYNYPCFLKPMALYFLNAEATKASEFYVKNIKITGNAFEEVKAESFKIYPQAYPTTDEIVYPVGAQFFLDKMFTPPNTTNKATMWSSSNDSVASIVSGVVTCNMEGSAIITASSPYGVSASYVVTVSNTHANVPVYDADFTDTIQLESGESIEVDTIYAYPSYTTDKVSLSTLDNIEISGTTIKPNESGIVTARIGNFVKDITVELIDTTKALAYINLEDVAGGNTSCISDTFDVTDGATYTLRAIFGTDPSINQVTSGIARNGFKWGGSDINRVPMISYEPSRWYASLTSPVTVIPSDGDYVDLVFTVDTVNTALWSVYKNGEVVTEKAQVSSAYYQYGLTNNRLYSNKRADLKGIYVKYFAIYKGDKHTFNPSELS